MIDLHGSPAQIHWADSIIETMLPALEEELLAYRSEPKLSPKVLAVYEYVMTQIRNQTTASWWISQRDKSMVAIVRDNSTWKALYAEAVKP